MGEKLYTAGEIAKIAGVSLRTIRFYDAKGLVKPVSYSEAGYRYYSQESLVVLQRVLMLKYLGFSLQQIEQMIQEDKEAQRDMDEQLAQQKHLLQEKKALLEQMIATIEIMEKSAEEDRWSYLVHLLNLLTDEEKIQEQYQNAANLEKRIRLHDYSTSSHEWMEWVYDRMELRENTTVLEVGCGNGLLWKRNIHRLPRGMHLVLTDRSEGMLEETRNSLSPFAEILKEHHISIEYRVADANELSLEEGKYDDIIANHMLYHVKHRESCLQEMAKALKPDGSFFCSTVGKTHMQELHELVGVLDTRIEMPFDFTAGFQLENGKTQLQQFFSKVERFDHDNDLIVDDIGAIFDYVYSYPGNAPFVLEQRGEEFRKLLRDKMERDGAVFIHKSTGMFVCRK